MMGIGGEDVAVVATSVTSSASSAAWVSTGIGGCAPLVGTQGSACIASSERQESSFLEKVIPLSPPHVKSFRIKTSTTFI